MIFQKKTKKTDRVAEGIDVACLVSVDTTDRDRINFKTRAGGFEKNLGFNFKTGGFERNFFKDLASQGAVPALRIWD